MAETIILATIHFCGGSGETSHLPDFNAILATINFCGGGGSGEKTRLPDFNADFNGDYRIEVETPQNED